MMFNWIGKMPDRKKAMAIPGLHWHDYGKLPRPGRKIGHATLTAESLEELKNHAGQLAGLADEGFPALLRDIFD
jgi:5-(carboxyamino)imidazole ribonucleotide synthase